MIANKMPLGKLSKSNIEKGYGYLKEISDELQKAKPSSARLSSLSSMFYTIIPHVFGMSRPPVISTPGMLKAKLEMVESLADIEIATTLIKQMAENVTENPIDLKYKTLGCGITHIEKTSSTFELIQTYVQNTHARTHNQYTLELLDVFEVSWDFKRDKKSPQEEI